MQTVRITTWDNPKHSSAAEGASTVEEWYLEDNWDGKQTNHIIRKQLGPAEFRGRQYVIHPTPEESNERRDSEGAARGS